MTTLAVFVVGLTACFALTPLVRWMACALGIVDYPRRRKVHKRPIPRLGGLAVYISWLIALTVSTTLRNGLYMTGEISAVVAIGMCVVIFGIWDDWKDMPGWLKLTCQLSIGLMVYWGGARIDIVTNPLGGTLALPWPLSCFITVAWVVGMMNAVNLIDGLDGLASGIAVFVCAGLIASAWHVGNYETIYILAGLAGACAGFLRYNVPPAKIFLGDSGSQFIGYLFAVTALIGQQYKVATAVSLLVPLSALLLPIYDTGLTIYRRIQGHQSLFRPDKYHLHHRLLSMGLTQRQVVLFFWAMTLYLSCLSFLFVLIPERYAVILLIMLVIGLTMAMQVLRFVEYKIYEKARRQRAKRRGRAARPDGTAGTT